MTFRWSSLAGLLISLLKRGLLLLLALVITGFVYQEIASYRDNRRFPPPGRLVNVGAYRLHLYCVGAGEPTVVFDSGLGSTSLKWRHVQGEVAQRTRSCAYDRAFLGWSDPGGADRSSRRIVDDLHSLLKNAGVPGPFLLVGHSSGGMNMLVYAGRYRQEVAGLVLVDSAVPKELIGETEAQKQSFQDWSKKQQRLISFLSLLTRIGLTRLYVSPHRPEVLEWLAKVPPDIARQQLALVSRPAYLLGVSQEWGSLAESAEQARSVASLGEMPLIVLTAAKGANPEWKQKWSGWHRELLRLSPNSKQIVSGQSGHLIPIEQPDLVVHSIFEALDSARSHSLLR